MAPSILNRSTSVGTSLLLVTIEEDRGLGDATEDDSDTHLWNGRLRSQVLHVTRPRLLIRKLGELPLGDRWQGDLRVDGNSIAVGPDVGHYSKRDFADGPVKPVVLRLDDPVVRPGVLRPCP